ncbi:MAG TPA: prepilin-type N-terminal cleavage/methylation domain-containing protein [bacterium]|nr:prepilin-type N-terminal cleavage/methylation domain-containing protein [bacterium]
MKRERGFTLIELLVVIAIIGVMAALVIVNLSSANRKSRDSRRKADLAEVKTALELYYDDEMGYPTGDYDDLDGTITPEYIKTLPQDPRDGADYYYSYTSDGDEYTLNATLENAEEGEEIYTVYSSN